MEKINKFKKTTTKASILWCSAFFIVQLSHPYMTTGKIIALTRWTFVGKVMSLLLNMLSGLVHPQLNPYTLISLKFPKINGIYSSPYTLISLKFPKINGIYSSLKPSLLH